ncbi:MAG: 4-alpha-glucanotransferase [Desulfopila sp.]
MKTVFSSRRRSGILAHITSLPSQYGIGDIGTASYSFLDFLSESGQSCWQFLPINPTDDLFDNSPYMTSSAFAGSPLLIAPDLLFAEGLISRQSLADHPQFSPYTTDYRAVREFKSRLLAEAFATFSQAPAEEFSQFKEDTPWLQDYALFMALKERFQTGGWFTWPGEIATRSAKALANIEESCSARTQYYCFEQYIFHQQWQLLKQKARDLDILLFGDIPIYVGQDSADVWANQDIFTLDSTTCTPTHVSGVPPDYFSATGQRWGNPLYRWDSADSFVQKQLENWWISRFAAIFKLVDIARIDHFRGFESYWAIPAENETAIEGVWRPGPGRAFFDTVFQQLGQLEIVAEDLGIITEKVVELRDELGFPGMKVLQFAFDGNPTNSFLPHNFTTPHCVVYTGTHDNDTSVGWFFDPRIDDTTRNRVKALANRTLADGSEIHNDLIYMALSSIATLVIVPLQDILGFGSDCRMNTPGVASGNWRWRCAPEYLENKETIDFLKARTERFSRYCPPQQSEASDPAPVE